MRLGIISRNVASSGGLVIYERFSTMFMRNVYLILFFGSISGLLRSQQPATFSIPMKREPVLINNNIQFLGGDIHNMMAVRWVVLKYDYSEMRVGNFESEGEYLKNETAGLSSEAAEKFVREWKTFPKQYMEPKFEEYFNAHSYKTLLRVTNDTAGASGDTILLIKAIKLDPDPRILGGYHSVTVICSFIAPNEDGLLYYQITSFGSKEFEIGKRLGECYAVAAKMLARKMTDDIRASEKKLMKQEKNKKQ